jgi:hypothetical protein
MSTAFNLTRRTNNLLAASLTSRGKTITNNLRAAAVPEIGTIFDKFLTSPTNSDDDNRVVVSFQDSNKGILYYKSLEPAAEGTPTTMTLFVNGSVYGEVNFYTDRVGSPFGLKINNLIEAEGPQTGTFDAANASLVEAQGTFKKVMYS